jgi:altronate dehydratase
MIAAYRRSSGAVGARNHLLVLPAVVCATQVASELGRDGAVAITHQHGCLHVGDDLSHSAATLEGVAINANVGGVVVVSLGCETLKGRRLAERIEARGQRVEFVGIQADGGTRRAAAHGRELVERMRALLAREAREPVPAETLTLGLDGTGPLADMIVEEASERGLAVVRPPAGAGAQTHPELAAMGAQVLVSLLGPGAAPVGFAVAPVIAVATDAATHAALVDDFDLDGSGESAKGTAKRIVDRSLEVLAGRTTAVERNGARDFVLRRLAVTM